MIGEDDALRTMKSTLWWAEGWNVVGPDCPGDKTDYGPCANSTCRINRGNSASIVAQMVSRFRMKYFVADPVPHAPDGCPGDLGMRRRKLWETFLDSRGGFPKDD